MDEAKLFANSGCPFTQLIQIKGTFIIMVTHLLYGKELPRFHEVMILTCFTRLNRTALSLL